VRKANYFNPDDHPQSGATPDVPSAFLGAADFYDSHKASHTGYFQYDCLNANREVTSRIRVVIREWNTKGELLALLAGDATADSDVTTTEGGLDQDDGFPAPDPGPDNDFLDWKDYQDLVTLGSDVNYRDFGFADLTVDPDSGAPGLSASAITNFLFHDVDYLLGFTCSEDETGDDD
jgi:hypothetical protein